MSKNLAAKKILIAEDDGFISEVYSTKLSLEGFDICIAMDGKEAWEKIKTEKPDCILLDIMMPKLDGLEILEKIKANSELKKLPVVILTNVGEKEAIDRAMSLGAVDYLIKSSHTPGEVVTKIKSLLS